MTGGAPLEAVRRYVANHPHADAMTVLAQLGLPPAHLETIKAVIAGEDPDPIDEERPSDPEDERLRRFGVDREDLETIENPRTVLNTTDEERAAMLREYLEAFVAEFDDVPRLMPLDEEGKAPIIKGRCQLDSPEARELLVDGDEAIRQIHEEGARGFAIYAGKWDHGTEGVAFVDHDDADAFPTPSGEPTLEVLSGSGRGPHETYRNDPEDPVANARVGDNVGEIRAENWYVVAPGSVHPSGGIYHLLEDREIAMLSDADLTDDMRPAAAHSDGEGANPALEDLDGEGRDPTELDDEDLEDRLAAAFANPHDGDRIKNVYNGNYAAAGFSDRSAPEFWLANRLDSYVGLGNARCVERVMDDGNLQKWAERTDRSYRKSVLSQVGSQEWYYDPDGQSGRSEREHDPIAVLPNSPKARAIAQGAGWTVSDTSSADAPSQQDIYDLTKSEISDTMRWREQAVIDAIMGGGKTYNSFLVAREREEKLAYFAPREELYKQGEQYALEVGYEKDEIHVLPSGPHDCPTFQGEHGEAAADRVWSLYNRGVTPKAIHNYLGDDLPCCDSENADGKCEYEQLLEFDPDEYEVIIGHYKHAHLPHVTGGRHVVVDENPTDAFMTRIEGDGLIQGVNAFLSLHDSPPFESFTDLLEHRHADDERRKKALAWFAGFDFEPDEQNAVRFETQGYHAYAPHAVYAVLTGEPIPGEDRYAFEKATLPGIGNEALFFTTSEQHGEYFVELQTPPELEYTRSVIALDGTPYVDPETADGPPEDKRATEWENALGRPLKHRQVLTDAQRGEFLTETQGNVYIQTSPYVKPYSSGNWNDKSTDAAKLRAIAETYGDGTAPLVFTEKKIREEYEEEFIEKGLAAEFDHSGNLRGSDEYASERFAVQLGSSHHGDHELRRRAAWLGAAVEPEGKGADRDYGDVGNGVLWQMREAQIAQNALRVGRDGRGAVVCLDTAAYPDWLPVENPDAPGDVSLWGPTERAVHEAVVSIREADGKQRTTTGITTDEIAEHIDDVSVRSVRRACRRQVGRGLLEKRADPDDGRRVRWIDTGFGDLDAEACAEVDLPELEGAGGFGRGCGQTTYVSVLFRLGKATERATTSKTVIAQITKRST